MEYPRPNLESQNGRVRGYPVNSFIEVRQASPGRTQGQEKEISGKRNMTGHFVTRGLLKRWVFFNIRPPRGALKRE